MHDKRYIESFLRLNQVPSTASPDEVRKVLTEARWADEEIASALIVIEGDNPAAEAELLEKHKEKTFRPDMDWSSSRLSSLLGMDVVVDPKTFHIAPSRRTRIFDLAKSILLMAGAAIVSLCVAGGIGFGLMYFFEIGPWRPPVDFII